MLSPAEPDVAFAARIVVPAAVRPRQGHRAGIVTRCGAGAVDLALACAAVVAMYAAWSTVSFLVSPRTFSFPDPPTGLLLVAVLGTLVAYLAAAWATTGQTYGDRLLGLRVVDRDGRRLRPVPAATRALLCALIPVLLFWVLVSRENRAGQDILLGTSVVYDWTMHAPPAPGDR